jgi:hypothetical protein
VAVIAVLDLVIALGVRGSFFSSYKRIEDPKAGSVMIPARLPAPRLVLLEPGGRIEGQSGPQGWSHLVFKSIPDLATGDLDTVSSQAFDTARRIRPVVVADIRQSELNHASSCYLARVGIGLCAPSDDQGVDRVISASSVDGTHGTWTAKQRVILTAMSYEVSRTRLAAATPTFALLRSPSTFLIGGTHRKVHSYQALLVDSKSGKLRVIVWRDEGQHDESQPAEVPARLLSKPVFDSPQDVHATKLLDTPVAWSFAMRELPPGRDLTIPSSLLEDLESGAPGPFDSAAIQQALIDRTRRFE